MDRIIDKIAAFGVPGLSPIGGNGNKVELLAEPPLFSALAALGGPIGMVGGIGLLNPTCHDCPSPGSIWHRSLVQGE